VVTVATVRGVSESVGAGSVTDVGVGVGAEVVTGAGVGVGVEVGAGVGLAAGPVSIAYVAIASGEVPLRAVMVKVLEPAPVGVPVIAPVLVSIVRPTGRAPAVTSYVGVGVPVAVTVNAYEVPTVPCGGLAEVMCGLLAVGPTGATHPLGTVIVLLSSVTAALRARSRPAMTAPVVALIDWSARIVP
jgi:hypothetical protein